MAVNTAWLFLDAARLQELFTTGIIHPMSIKYLTIIPRARIGLMGYWLRGHEGERNNCFSKIQLVDKKYRDKTTSASKTRFSGHCFGFQSRCFPLLVGYSLVAAQPIRMQHWLQTTSWRLLKKNRRSASLNECYKDSSPLVGAESQCQSVKMDPVFQASVVILRQIFSGNFSSCAQSNAQAPFAIPNPYEQFFKFAFGSGIYILTVSLITIIVNGLLLLVFFFDPLKLFRNATTYFLVSLAVVDILPAAVQEPVYATCFIMMYTRHPDTRYTCPKLLWIVRFLLCSHLLSHNMFLWFPLWTTLKM